MTLTIAGSNYTSSILDGTLTIRKFGTLRSSFYVKLTLTGSGSVPKAGEEILLTEKDQVLWGGILIETEIECHSPSLASVTLRGQGYEQILQRFCLPRIVLDEMTPTDAATLIFNEYVPQEDGLTVGIIDPGPGLSNAYDFYPAKASSVFDYLAKENGYFWWVDADKKFYMRGILPLTSSEISIDLTEKDPNRLIDLQTFVLRESTAGYRNVHIAYNKHNYAYYKSFHVEELGRMIQRYGSGQYGAATNSSLIQTQTDAQLLAEQMLSSAPGPDEIEFTTDSNCFILGQVISVTAPVCGIKEPQNFTVSETKAVYFAGEFRYTVTATRRMSDTPVSLQWEQALAAKTTN